MTRIFVTELLKSTIIPRSWRISADCNPDWFMINWQHGTRVHHRLVNGDWVRWVYLAQHHSVRWDTLVDHGAFIAVGIIRICFMVESSCPSWSIPLKFSNKWRLRISKTLPENGTREWVQRGLLGKTTGIANWVSRYLTPESAKTDNNFMEN